jgi:hypothetical protein
VFLDAGYDLVVFEFSFSRDRHVERRARRQPTVRRRTGRGYAPQRGTFTDSP